MNNAVTKDVFSTCSDNEIISNLFNKVISNHDAVYIWRINSKKKNRYKVFLVKNFSKKNEFSIAVPKATIDEISYFIGEDKNIFFYIPGRGLLFNAKILIKSIENSLLNISLNYPDKVAIVEKRRNLRFNLERDKRRVTLIIPVSSFFSSKGKTILRPCIDISTDGISFEALKAEEKIFEKGKIISNISLQLGNEKTLAINIKVVNVVETISQNETSLKKNVIKIGCSFQNISKEVRLKINEYVMKLYYEKITEKSIQYKNAI